MKSRDEIIQAAYSGYMPQDIPVTSAGIGGLKEGIDISGRKVSKLIDWMTHPVNMPKAEMTLSPKIVSVGTPLPQPWCKMVELGELPISEYSLEVDDISVAATSLEGLETQPVTSKGKHTYRLYAHVADITDKRKAESQYSGQRVLCSETVGEIVHPTYYGLFDLQKPFTAPIQEQGNTYTIDESIVVRKLVVGSDQDDVKAVFNSVENKNLFFCSPYPLHKCFGTYMRNMLPSFSVVEYTLTGQNKDTIYFYYTEEKFTENSLELWFVLTSGVVNVEQGMSGPVGPKGDKGDRGASITRVDAELTEDNATLVRVYSDEDSQIGAFMIPAGLPGEVAAELPANKVNYGTEAITSVTNVQEALDAIMSKLFYVKPAITSFAMTLNINDAVSGDYTTTNTVLERGQNITAAVFTWEVNKNVTSQKLGTKVLQAEDRSYTMPLNLTSGTHSFTLTVGDGQSTDSKTKTLKYVNRFFVGKASSLDQVSSEMFSSDKSYVINGATQFDITLDSAEYILMALPVGMTLPPVDQVPPFIPYDWSANKLAETVQITNALGANIECNVYYSPHAYYAGDYSFILNF